MLLLLACTGAPPDKPSPIAWCEGEAAYDYAPAEVFTTFPDDYWTVEDASTATGLRVSMPADAVALEPFPDEYDNLLEQLGTLDGFGLSPPVMLQFDHAPTLEGLEVVLAVREGDTWVSKDITVTTLDFGRTLSIAPWRPLPPGSRVVVGVRSDAAEADCVSPSPALRLLLDPASTEPLADRYAEGLDALGWAPEEVGAMVVYTTQSAEDVDAAVATWIATSEPQTNETMWSNTSGSWRSWYRELEVADFRASNRIVPEGPVAAQSTYLLPVSIWLPPAELPGPYPVVLCGHGLGGSRGQCDFLADLLAPKGFATVAVDAQQHGDHPLRTADDGELDQVMGLFGFTLTPPSLDALVLRDNFRASAWDKLQVLRAIARGFDVDGDGVVDLDPNNVQYAGASLGGIMGPEVLAWGDVASGALLVPGGGLMNLILDSDTFSVIAVAMKPDDWDDDELARSIPMVQTLIDAGDPVVHAAALTRRRATTEGPDVALLMAYDDAIVPNSSTAALARALAVTGVGEELYATPGVTFHAGPVSGNLPDAATGAWVSFAETQPYADGAWEPADHSTLHESVQASTLLEPWVTAVYAGETPTITAE